MSKADPSGVPLANATFKVTSAADPSFLTQMTTSDPSGSVTLANLTPGMYCLEEVAVPQGYLLQPTYTPSNCVAVNPDPKHDSPSAVSVVDPPAPTPPPTPTPTPTPVPSPTPTPTLAPMGELQVVKTDPAGHTVTTPGFTFDLHLGSSSGPVVATVTTDTTGTAIAALSPTTHCVEETGAADGYQVAPTYTPGACVTVAVDPTKGSNPTTVTVADPVSAGGASSSTARPPPSPARARVASHRSTSTAVSSASLAVALLAFGAVLSVTGVVMIAVGMNRRHPGVALR
ncbi:MAG TPA: prealbumin-like fold domain-containing protein [Candidatus Dormibacteraeota bacterium]|nr:prealbumin-like fold domain-containing protein [Candidatus Dormibacteraeota bacterium]